VVIGTAVGGVKVADEVEVEAAGGGEDEDKGHLASCDSLVVSKKIKRHLYF
jgi:hypothetical protein